MSSYSFKTMKQLTGSQLNLNPLTREDLRPLARALISAETWFSKTREINSEDRFVEYFLPKVEQQDRGECLTLVARKNQNNELVAMSTYQYPSPGFRKVEIGFTWVADRWQRTFVNTEMKFLMLKHAFETMETNRVEFWVHPNNEKSNGSMKRIGAKFEGCLRKWRFMPGSDDGNRNIYSIIDDEWPIIRANLSSRIASAQKAATPAKFKINKKFNALPVDDGDEFFRNGIFEFNITKLLAYIKARPLQFPVEQVLVKKYAIWESKTLNEATVEAANLENPIVLGEISPGSFNVIDGNHRLEKARRLSIETIPAYRVSAEHHLAFITSNEAYETYIKYWNSKVEDWEPNAF